jgi:diguanylate cyclase (GGDEF)-like protein
VVAVLLLDLDGFKHINDRLGHAAGDEILQTVAQRLTVGLRSGETAARLGGDEFGLLLEESQDPKAAVSVAERILAALRRPMALGGREGAISGASASPVALGMSTAMSSCARLTWLCIGRRQRERISTPSWTPRSPIRIRPQADDR